MKRGKSLGFSQMENPVDRRQDDNRCMSGVMLYHPLEAGVSALTLTVCHTLWLYTVHTCTNTCEICSCVNVNRVKSES